MPDSNAPERVVVIGGEFTKIMELMRDLMPKVNDERSGKDGEPHEVSDVIPYGAWS